MSDPRKRATGQDIDMTGGRSNLLDQPNMSQGVN